MRARRGLTLIEVLVALVIVGVAAASWASFAGQSGHAMRLASARDAESWAAAQLLARLSLWNRDRLGAIGGRRVLGGFVVTTRPDGDVIDVAVADTASTGGGRVILRTSFYRPQSSAGGP